MPANVTNAIKAYDTDYFSFSLIGVAFTTYFTMAMSEFSSLMRRDQMAGCFEALLSSQTGIKSIVFMSALFKFIHNGTTLIFMFLFAMLFLHFRLPHINWPSTIISFIFSLVLFVSLGIFSAAGTILFKQGEPFGFFFGTVGSLLGGAVFPVSLLPAALKPVAFLVPITHALETLRLSMLRGYTLSQLTSHLTTLTIMSLILFPASLKFFEWAVEKGKKNGTLGQY
jgi:ABC-2 type transport system permease protein